MPHMFISELKLSANVLRADVRRLSGSVNLPREKQLAGIRDNLLTQIGYYQGQVGQMVGEKRKRIEGELANIKRSLISLTKQGSNQ